MATFHLEDGADLFFLCLICALRCCRRLVAQTFWSGKKKTKKNLRNHEILSNNTAPSKTENITPNLQEVQLEVVRV